MRRKYWFLSITVVCTLIAAHAARAELETVWAATCGGPQNDGFRSAVETSDGSIVAAGYTYSLGAGDVDMFVVKTDQGGDTLWTRAIGGEGRDYAYGVCEAPTGGYAVAGFTTSVGAGREDVYVVKLDADGNVVWARTYGGAGSDEGRAICATSDGCLVVSGRTDSFGAGQSDVYVLKLDADGDTLWTRAFGGAGYDWGEGVCEAADGCYFVSGTAGSYSTSRDIYVLKIDDTGAAVWADTYGDASSAFSHDWGAGCCALADSGVGVAGNKIVLAVDPDEVFFLRIDQLGTQTALKRYASTFIEYGCSVCETPDDGFLVCGAEKNESTLKNDLLLVKRVPGSNWVWEQTLGGAGSDWGSSVVAMSAPGYYLISGHTESYGAGGYDGWLLKMREPLASVRGGEGAVMLAVPRPNPSGLRTELRFSIARQSDVDLAVYDVAGRRVKLLVCGPSSAGEHAVVWDGRDEAGLPVAPGVYLARIVTGEESAVRKIVRIAGTRR